MSKRCPVRCWWRKRKKRKINDRPPRIETERAVIERIQADLETLSLVEARIMEIESLLKDGSDGEDA